MKADDSDSSPSEAGVTVVKISGTLLDQPADLDAFWRSVANLADSGPLVLVHGGGKQATALAERLGHTPTVVQGRRVTTDLDLDIVQWALCGKINTQLVAAAKQHGLRAVGLSGADDSMLQVEKRPAWTVDGEQVDFGWVGDVVGVDPDVLHHLVASGRVPVVAPLGIDDAGQVYNVNADTVAQNIAAALGASKLLLVTASGGVRREAESAETHLDTCDADMVATGIAEGWIEGGMRVKVETALAALDSGVREAFICAANDLLARSHATQVVA
ncbi:acetylglutamate kinase [Longibacter salinarum]|uniref:Acetylglutamate kinase n=1 Tax=Longibacter salinarum TaxID=1850348 RepID=A0A2A8D0B7_9BACT|nr:acetylglutamate kinase [Longibacter salinarum]PEN14419.1 acetylglutamate kinase [Longibacter salinarum]